MTHVPHKKAQAVSMRSNGASLDEIARKLHIAKSTVSIWMRKVHISDQAAHALQQRVMHGREKGLSRIRKNRNRLYKYLEQRGQATITQLTQTLRTPHWKLIAALLFWCEGNKQFSSLQFANSDPKLMRAFLSALRKGFVINESKFRAVLHLHEYHNEETQVAFWSNLTGIPRRQFLKAYKKRRGGTRKREGYPGCLSVRYYDAALARELKAVYDAFAKNTGAW